MDHLSKFTGISVSQRPGEDSEHLIKRFIRKVRESDVHDRPSRFVKPSDKRRKKRAINAWRRARGLV